jgi:hypothetical protein
LNDIRFEFAVGKDSAEGIASELVGAGLVDGRDIVVIAANLQKLIDSGGQLRTVTFPLVSKLVITTVLFVEIECYEISVFKIPSGTHMLYLWFKLA